MKSRSRRQMTLRRIDSLILHCEHIIGLAAQIGMLYDQSNSECAPVMLTCIEAAEILKDMLEKLRKEL